MAEFVDDKPEPIKAGLLLKKGEQKKMFKSSRRRHFSLYPDELVIAEEEGGALLHRVSMETATVVQPPQMPTPTSLAVITAGRAFEMVAETAEEAAEWGQAVEKAAMAAQAVALERALAARFHPHEYHDDGSIDEVVPKHLLSGRAAKNDGTYSANYTHAYLRRHRVSLGTPHAFALGGNYEALKQAIEAKQKQQQVLSPSEWGADDDEGATPLHCAAYAGGLREMKLLLDAEPALAAAADDGALLTPLHAAALGAQPAAARMLVEAQAQLGDSFSSRSSGDSSGGGGGSGDGLFVDALNSLGHSPLDVAVLRSRDMGLCSNGSGARLPGTLQGFYHVGDSVAELLKHGDTGPPNGRSNGAGAGGHIGNGDNSSSRHARAFGNTFRSSLRSGKKARGVGLQSDAVVTRSRSSTADMRLDQGSSSEALEDLKELIVVLCEAGADASTTLAKYLVDDDDDVCDDGDDPSRRKKTKTNWYAGRSFEVLPPAIVGVLLRYGAKPNLRKLSGSGGSRGGAAGKTPLQRLMRGGIPSSWLSGDALKTKVPKESAKASSKRFGGGKGRGAGGKKKPTMAPLPTFDMAEEGDVEQEHATQEVLLLLLAHGARPPSALLANAGGSSSSPGVDPALASLLRGAADDVLADAAAKMDEWRAREPPPFALNDGSAGIAAVTAAEAAGGGGGGSKTRSKKATRAKEGWVADGSSNACFGCRAAFTTTNRRHHCRTCGELVCGYCSGKQLYYRPLDNKGVGLKDMKLSRACDRCFNMAVQQERTAERGAALLQAIDRGLAVVGNVDDVENNNGADGSERKESSSSSSREGDGFEDDAPDGAAEGGVIAIDDGGSKDAMADGIQQLEQNGEALQRIGSKAVSLRESASQYRELTKQMKNASVQ